MSTLPPITPAILWRHQPLVVKATVGRSVRQLMEDGKQGLTVHIRGTKPRREWYWLTSEVIAFYNATSQTNHELFDQPADHS